MHLLQNKIVSIDRSCTELSLNAFGMQKIESTAVLTGLTDPNLEELEKRIGSRKQV